jgi:hypothetical protein
VDDVRVTKLGNADPSDCSAVYVNDPPVHNYEKAVNVKLNAEALTT